MGFFSKMIKSQLVDVIEWQDDSRNTIAWRYDCEGKEIMMGAQLTVRESQMAVFVNEGKLADVFAPGMYTLETSNMPVMTALQSWPHGFKSPFKAEVYFINTRRFVDCKWGTSNPIMMRDNDFGMIRLRAFGVYAFRAVDPALLLREVLGTAATLSVEDVEGQIKRTIISGLSDILGQSGIPALDLASQYDELSNMALNALSPRIEEMGLRLESFAIENISLPQEVEQTMDRRTSMGVVGDMNRYAQFQAAEAMREAANNPGNNAASAGIGMGTGMAMVQMFGTMMNNNTQQQVAAPVKNCIACGHAIPVNAKFCPECGANQNPGCKNCGAKLAPGTKFCPECGQKQ
ncbi:MAG: SPFH domain-containing protein [Clostridia bacterium]|nr:SPFH domain-containing protein [Clostridia bacterium]